MIRLRQWTAGTSLILLVAGLVLASVAPPWSGSAGAQGEEAAGTGAADGQKPAAVVPPQPTAPPAQNKRPSFALTDKVLKLEGASDGRAYTQLTISGLEPAMSAVALETPHDEGELVGLPATVGFTAKELQPGGSNSRSWVLIADVRGLPANSEQKRFVTFKLGQDSATLDYTLTNRLSTQLTLKLTPPQSPISIGSKDPAIALGVGVTGGARATDLKIVEGTLVNAQTKSSDPNARLRLCLEQKGDCFCAAKAPTCDRRIVVDADKPRTLWLRPAEGASLGAGQYTGKLQLTAMEKPVGDEVSVTLAVTDCWRQLIGFFVIAIGVVSAWFLNVYLRNRLTRSHLLLPATALRERLFGLKERLQRNGPERHDVTAVKTIGRLDKSIDDLDDSKLDALLPPRNPFALSALSSAVGPQIDEYKTLLATTSQWAAVLDLIVEQGLLPAFRKLTPGALDAVVQAATDAVGKIDDQAAGETVPALASVQAVIIDALAEIHKAEMAAAASKAALAANAAAAGQAGLAADDALLGFRAVRAAVQTLRPRSSEELRVEVTALNVLFWVVSGVLTIVIGTFAVVLNNIAFGTAWDYLYCFLWGFGLPATAQALATATSTTVPTALGITIPGR